jgi:histidinol dehydrogenase
VQCENAEEYLDHIINAGSVFLGPWSPESAGDYASGTNHTLPTYGYARMYSGVSVDSFMKFITVQQLSKKGLKNLGPTVETLAELEELEGHKRAVSIRLSRILNDD